MKLKIMQLESRIDSSPSPEAKITTRGRTIARNSHDRELNFMSRHPVVTTTQDPLPPLITPFQFIYTIGNHHVKEVESYKFRKAKLNVQCSGKDKVFTFYNTLRHITTSFNIIIRPLKHIRRKTGTCQLIEDNCVGYKPYCLQLSVWSWLVIYISNHTTKCKRIFRGQHKIATISSWYIVS